MKQVSLAKQVDTYIEDIFITNNEDLSFAIKNSKKHNLPPIQITPVIGKFLYLQTKMIAAQSILEIGTLGGYSTLWLEKALSDGGHIVTIEHNKEYAAVAKENFQFARVDKKIEIKIGEALTILETLQQPFDLIFIDANKEEYMQYMEHAIRLARPGTVIICDNVIRNGGVLQEKPEKEYYKILADFNKKLASNPKLDSTILPLTIPLKDRDYVDGLSISIIRG